MKKNYHFAEHIYKLLAAVLLAFVISFYLTLFLGTNVLICAVVSVQTTVGILIYLYLHWGYNMSPRDRSSYSEFLIGMLPAQAIHFSIYAVLYFLFVKVCEYKIFESLPIHRVAVNTPVLGFSFVLTKIKVLDFTERMDENATVILPKHLFPVFLCVFFIFLLICFAVCLFCYRRGISLNEKGREDMLQGVQPKPKRSFTTRFWLFPIINIFPLLIYLHRHFFLIEYKIRDAVFPLVTIVGIRLLCNLLISVILFHVPTLWMYFFIHFITLYLWGILISYIVLREERARDKTD